MKETMKFIGYIVFMIPFMIVGVTYKLLKSAVHYCADFDKNYK